MLAIDSYLRRMPAGLDRYQRLILESLVTASDIASVAYMRLEAAAVMPDLDVLLEASHPQRIGMLSDAWTIVDAIHTSRVLLNSLGIKQVTDLAAKYLDLTVAAWSMRNDMAHLPQKLGNFSKRRGIVPALFGTVQFTRTAEFGQHTHISLPFGSPVEKWAVSILTPKMLFREGVPSIYLEAFGQAFALQPICAALVCLLERIATVIEPSLAEGLTKLAGDDLEELAKALFPIGMDCVVSLTGPLHDSGGAEIY